jgi:hypothetical protein
MELALLSMDSSNVTLLRYTMSLTKSPHLYGVIWHISMFTFLAPCVTTLQYMSMFKACLCMALCALSLSPHPKGDAGAVDTVPVLLVSQGTRVSFSAPNHTHHNAISTRNTWKNGGEETTVLPHKRDYYMSEHQRT